MDEAGGREPNAEEDADELREADRVGRAQQAQVLEDVWEGHEAERPEEAQTWRSKQRRVSTAFSTGLLNNPLEQVSGNWVTDRMTSL